MKSRETVQLVSIGILGILLLAGIFTNFGRTTTSLAEETKIVETQPENSVVQITSKTSETDPNITINGNPLEKQSTKLGSGFIYSDSGLIITNNHVIKGSKTVDVTFVDGNTYSANVIGTDPYSDIAVLQITDDFSEEDMMPLPLGDSSGIQVGDQVVAI